MLIEQALLLLLKADTAGVFAITGERIYPGVLPQTVTYPAIAFRPPNSGNREVERSLDDRLLIKERLSFFCAAHGFAKYEQAAKLDNAIFKALDNFTGEVPDTTVSPQESIRIQLCQIVDGRGHLYLGYDQATETHQFLTEFEITYEEPLTE